MKVIAQEGQSLFDIALEVYGDLTGYWWLLEDNGLDPGHDVQAGDELEIREDYIKSDAKFFRASGRRINNSSDVLVNQVEPLTISIVEVRNEIYGADGFVKVKVSGGKPAYGYLWSNGSTGKNLIHATAGVYSLTVEDARGNVATVTVSIAADTSGSILARNPGGEIILTSGGDSLRLNVPL